MARLRSMDVLSRRNSKLDSFLKRNTERDVYERIRAYEPCVVISESVNKVYMHVVLSDECVYLAEYPPRTITAAVSFSNIRDIELVNDLPDFLRGKDREFSQHIRVLYSITKPAGKRDDWLGKGKKKEGQAPDRKPSRRNLQLLVSQSLEGVSSLLSQKSWRVSPEPLQSHQGAKNEEEEEVRLLRSMRSASCPDLETLGLVHPPPRCSTETPSSSLTSPWTPPSGPPLPTSPLSPLERAPEAPEAGQVLRRRDFVLDRLLKRERARGDPGDPPGGEREAELHLYAVSRASHIYLHLQNSWNSYIIRSTLMLDPHYRRNCSISSNSSPRKCSSSNSWERTAHLFGQLSGEILRKGISLESLYLLLQELRTAAQRNITLRHLFWQRLFSPLPERGSSSPPGLYEYFLSLAEGKTASFFSSYYGDVCVFLVQTLEDSLHSCQSSEPAPKGVHAADHLLLCTLIAQTLSVMFRETEVEPSRHSMLTAERGALTVRMVLAVVCDPELHKHAMGAPLHSELQTLLAEYLDSACTLLFELLVLGQEASRCSSLENFLTVGWILRVLQPHPHLLSFIGYQAQQVVSALSDAEKPTLSPASCVLLFRRCRVLLACLQYSRHLGQYLRSHFREEFQYVVKPSCASERLPAHYPISQPTQRLIHQLLALILHR